MRAPWLVTVLLVALVPAGCDHDVVANLVLTHAGPGPLAVQVQLCNAPCQPPASGCSNCGICLAPLPLLIGDQPLDVALRSRDDRQFSVVLQADAGCGATIEIDVAEGEALPFDIDASFGCPSQIALNSHASARTKVAERTDCRGL